MNLHKECHKCRKYFPSKLMSFEIYCDKKECQACWDHTIETIKKRVVFIRNTLIFLI